MILDGGDDAPSSDPTAALATPRSLFAERLSDLFTAAGNPTLDRVATATSRRLRPAQGRDGGKPVSFKRISDWKTGRNVPAKFESLAPVLVTLIDLARTTGRPLPPASTDLKQWRALWGAAVAWRIDTHDPEAVCPYRGLSAYGTEHATWFFGRATATAELTTRVHTVADAGGGIVALVGASGAGKSSLLHAGLIPVLTTDTDAWQITAFTPGPDPHAALAAALDGPIARWSAGKPGLLVIDQFEELFTTDIDDSVRERFLAAVQEFTTTRSAPRVAVLGIRADFFARCLDHRVLEHALNNRAYLLGPMRSDELADTITGPATLAGLRLESGLVDLVLTELRGPADTYDPGVLPLLSHVMAATWNHREGRQLSLEGYRKTGGVIGSVADTAESVWGRFTLVQRIAAKSLLVQLVDVDPDGRDTRRIAGRRTAVGGSEDPEATEAVLEALVSARLVTLDADRVLFTHEIVLNAWPRLRGWIEEDRVGHLIHQRLVSDAAEWAAGNHDSGLLYRGARFTTAETVADRLPATGTAVDFLAAARSARRRSRRFATATRTSLALLGVGILILALTAYAQGRLRTQKENSAAIATLLAEADGIRDSDPSLSAQLDLAALNRDPSNDEARVRVLATQNLPLSTPLDGHLSAVTALAAQPGGHLLASGSADSTIRLWDSAPGTSGSRSAGPPIDTGFAVAGLGFSADGTLLIAASGRSIGVWNVEDPAHPRTVSTADTGRTITKVAFSRTNRLAVATDDRTVGLWGVDNTGAPHQLTILPTLTDPVTALAFGPSASWLAVADDNAVQLWATTDPRSATPLAGPLVVPSPKISALAVAPDGGTMAVGSSDTIAGTVGRSDATVTLWSTKDPARTARIGGPVTVAEKTEMRSLAFAPDSQSFAVGVHDGASVWSITDPAQPVLLGEPLMYPSPPCPTFDYFQPCADGPASILFGADWHTVTTGGALGSVRLWSLPSAIVGSSIDWGLAPGLSQTGRMITSTIDGHTFLWDITGERPRRLADLGPGPNRTWLFTPSLSSDGNLALITTGDRPTLRLVDISDPLHARTIMTLPDTYLGTFSTDMKTLITFPFGDTSAFQVWNLTDREHPLALGAAVPFGSYAIPRPVGLQTWLWTDWGGAHGFVTETPEESPQSAQTSPPIKLWDLSDPAKPVLRGQIPADPHNTVTYLVVTNDGENLVTGQGNSLQSWDIHDPAHPVKAGRPISTHGLNMHDITISPDDRQLVSTGTDSTVHLWDYRDRTQPRLIRYPLAPTGGPAWDVGFDPLGAKLVGSRPNTLAIWDLDENHARQRICTTTAGVLTPEVWKIHLPDLAYDPPCPQPR